MFAGVMMTSSFHSINKTTENFDQATWQFVISRQREKISTFPLTIMNCTTNC